MKKILILALSIFMILITGCGDVQESKTSPPEKKSSTAENSSAEKNSNEKISAENKSHGKILIAYFSRAGDNYEVGIIEKGNTRIVADMIAEKVDADVFEIKPVKNYPADYRECTEVAKAEKESDARPEIVGKVENFEQYDTIFLGYPNWWSDLPMIMYTFMESYNFSGKTIIPFCTSSSDYFIGKREIEAYAKGSTVRDGLGIRGKLCQDNPESVRQDVTHWLEDLGF